MPSHLHSVDPPSTNFTSGIESANHAHGDDHIHSGETATMAGGVNANHSHGGTLYEWTGGAISGSGRVYYTRNSNATNGAQSMAPGINSANIDHYHGFATNSKSSQGYGTATGGVSANHTHTTTVDIAAFNSASTGGGGAHNNLQPYIVLNYIIKH